MPEPMLAPKLIVRIKDPEIGKGWYTATINAHPDTKDEYIFDVVARQNPDATAVEITRQYMLPAGARIGQAQAIREWRTK